MYGLRWDCSYSPVTTRGKEDGLVDVNRIENFRYRWPNELATASTTDLLRNINSQLTRGLFM